VKYKEEGKKEMSVSLYSLLPETIDTRHAREAAHLQSQVLVFLWSNNTDRWGRG